MVVQSVEGIGCDVSSRGGVESRAVVLYVYKREREQILYGLNAVAKWPHGLL